MLNLRYELYTLKPSIIFCVTEEDNEFCFFASLQDFYLNRLIKFHPLLILATKRNLPSF